MILLWKVHKILLVILHLFSVPLSPLIFTNVKFFVYFLFFSIWLGGVFKLELFLPEEYPMAPPKVIYCKYL